MLYCYSVYTCFQHQYVYLHEAVAEALLFGTELVHTRQFGDVYNYMIQKEKGSTRTRIMEQFSVWTHSIKFH